MLTECKQANEHHQYTITIHVLHLPHVATMHVWNNQSCHFIFNSQLFIWHYSTQAYTLLHTAEPSILQVRVQLNGKTLHQKSIDPGSIPFGVGSDLDTLFHPVPRALFVSLSWYLAMYRALTGSKSKRTNKVIFSVKYQSKHTSLTRFLDSRVRSPVLLKNALFLLIICSFSFC